MTRSLFYYGSLISVRPHPSINYTKLNLNISF